MPRYFFNIHDGKDILDDLGYELLDLDAAKKLSVTLSGDCLRDHALEFWTGEEWTMEVTDEHGLTLFSLLFVAISAPSTSGPTSNAPDR